MTDRMSTPPRPPRTVLTFAIPGGVASVPPSAGPAEGPCGCPPEAAADPTGGAPVGAAAPGAAVPTSTLAEEIADLFQATGDNTALLWDLLTEYLGDALAPAAAVHLAEVNARLRHLTDLAALRAGVRAKP